MSKCRKCDGMGNSPGYNVLTAFVAELIDAGARAGHGQAPTGHFKNFLGFDKLPVDLAQLTTGLTGRPPIDAIMGHDALDRHEATHKIVQAAGLTKAWELCPSCKGSGER